MRARTHACTHNASLPQFGPILEVVASRGVRLRGQAWVVFRDLESANAAKRKLTDAIFFDTAIQIAFAKTKSDVVAKSDGTFIRRTKRAAQRGEVNRIADPEKRAAKKRLLEAKNKGSGMNAPTATPLADAASAPNKLLFVQNLPRKFYKCWLNCRCCSKPLLLLSNSGNDRNDVIDVVSSIRRLC